MERHFTVSGFVVHEGKVALHWHRKNLAWLPAGGHVEPNEDPVEATLREVREEFALEARVLPLPPIVNYEGGPRQIDRPYAILDCWPEADHGHVDLVYFLEAVSGFPGRSHDPENPIHWFSLADLDLGSAAHSQGPAESVAFPPDVRALAIAAIREAAAALGRVAAPEKAGTG